MRASSLDLRYIAAPMVNQSDLPFRLLVRRYGVTLPYTQMYIADRLLEDREYLEYHLQDLSLASDNPYNRPVVAQLGGNDTDTLVRAGRKIQGLCDAIDLNLGCPQESARDGHYGAYLLPQKDWPLIESIVSAMSKSFTVPVSAKLRLCQPTNKTVDLAQKIEGAGASWITLHARTVSAKRRRQGAANLEEVKRLKECLGVPVISNGNVRSFSDLECNRNFTSANGLMVGETLLGNPCIFAGPTIPDPVDISLEYIYICKEYPGTSLKIVQTHIRHFVEFQCSRRSWFPKFRAALSATNSLDELERLLSFNVERWRGRFPRGYKSDDEQATPAELHSDIGDDPKGTGVLNDSSDFGLALFHPQV
ncbi:FMN-linked oxidoreductase [Crepidotus variabilis]|uniref:tRNA-dihydrouridine synthase n=1 Tax=Crepidotus variabilis TaxID=179855 RepID=A0A9P6EJG6_9AGAR|nr:FMN-linked oxidoreductase [Crepidotus variabilis]